MPDVNGCHFPDDLIYDVLPNTWYREEADGTVRIGMTALAVALAGKLVAFTPKKVGKRVEFGKSCATVESGKWVGPAKSAVAGDVMAVNESLTATPAEANADPYGAGWMVVLQPLDWAADKGRLVPGDRVGPDFAAKMSAESFAGCGGTP